MTPPATVSATHDVLAASTSRSRPTARGSRISAGTPEAVGSHVAPSGDLDELDAPAVAGNRGHCNTGNEVGHPFFSADGDVDRILVAWAEAGSCAWR